IKPDNLMLTRAGVVKGLDFGLARFAHAGDEVTITGQIMRTPAYIAPEHAESARKADIRSDIFSLGCMLFFLLTGRVPFAGQGGMETITARLKGEAIPLRKVRQAAPAALEAVLRKMVKRDPQDRYQTPYEVAAALAPFARLAETETVDL